MSFDLFRAFETGAAVVEERRFHKKYSPLSRSLEPIGGKVKRGVDIAFAICFASLCLPLFLGLILMIKITSRGPVFYGHTRIGFNGRKFRCWKFRSMYENGDSILEKHFREYPEDRLIWQQERKLKNDPRVTPIGAVLRKLSLDELPQIVNVLTGEMSLIGPRPVVEDELEIYATSRKHYLRSRPGVTGLWQVSGRSDTSYFERIKLDRYYVTQWRPLLDLWILFRTIPAVLLSRGAH